MRIINDPVLFDYELLHKICKEYKAQFVIDTEYKSIPCTVFYGLLPHPTTGTRYFALYLDPETKKLCAVDGIFVEDQTFDGIVADNGDIIFSRHPTDYRVSDDGSVWINGSGEHTERPVVNIDRLVKISVFKGRVEVWFDSD